jgi:hypothetical protein
MCLVYSMSPFHPLESNASGGQDGAQSVHATYFCLEQIPLLNTVGYTRDPCGYDVVISHPPPSPPTLFSILTVE